jgi:hypothetical protein
MKKTAAPVSGGEERNQPLMKKMNTDKTRQGGILEVFTCPLFHSLGG